ncbi:MAG TPA: hypothetical protein VHP81_10010 [Lachnospiraceae bacterium]|nr:hypothetical protein [Lachnospiraceae bacterium]
MEENLRQKLLYVRGLIVAMDSLNKNQERCESQKRAQHQYIPYENKKKSGIGKWILIVLGIFVLLVVYYTKSYLDYSYATLDMSKYTYSRALFEVMMISVPRAATQSAILAGVIAVIIYVKNYSRHSNKQKVELLNREHQQENALIRQKNNEMDQQIDQLVQRKQAISNEYTRNCIQWYPKDYGYLSAVDYFINQVDNHLASTMKEAVNNYIKYINDLKEEEFRNTVTSQNDEMIRQQMIGNSIQMANYHSNLRQESYAASAASAANEMNTRDRMRRGY